MKKIVIATGLYPPESGGPATYTKLLEERLPLLNFPARDGQVVGFEVLVLPFRTVRRLPKGVRHVVYFFMCVGYAMVADVVYAQDTLSVGLPAVLAAKMAGKPFLVRVPGDYAWEQGRQRFGVTDELDAFQTKKYGGRVERMRRIQRFVVRRAAAVIVPSEYMKRVVAGWGVKPVLIYNGIDLPVQFELPAERPQGFLIVSFGRDVPWKGFDGLRRVAKREPGWVLQIFSELPRVQAMGWLRSADAFVINSTYEGLSHQLLEAMALGTPVVATAVGGNPELITDGETGLLIPPGDDGALYQALKNIEQNKEAALKRAGAAGEKVQGFSIDKTLEQLCGLLKTL
ncbi:MAG: glycosyltransferase family 4 protein [Patescibacteria group bacterium]